MTVSFFVYVLIGRSNINTAMRACIAFSVPWSMIISLIQIKPGPST